MRRVLVTGSLGQIGVDLVRKLSDQYGDEAIVPLDVRDTRANGHGNLQHEVADVRDAERLDEVIHRYDIGTIYHLASLLSAAGEKRPDQTWSVNMDGLKNVLDRAREENLKIFWPSSIAVFGSNTPKNPAPQDTILQPSTMYGVTKVSGELMCNYYHQRYGVDVRSLRYPGLVSYKTPPGGGTTDFAVEIFHAAAHGEDYTCFVHPDTRLPMMYMPDAVKAALDVMAADSEDISIRTSYNIGALSFTAGELAGALQKRLPEFTCTFEPDERQKIADSWPSTVDDSAARSDWNWHPDYNLDALVDDMLANLQARESKQK